MGTNPVNLIDAIAETNVRQARANASIVRIGRIASAPLGGAVTVMIGGGGVDCQWLNGYYPVVGDQVAVLATKDGFIVIGSVNDKPNGVPHFVGTVAGTYGTGWGAGPYANYGYRFGPLAWRRISVTRTGAALTVPTSGYVSPAQLLFTPTDAETWGCVQNAVSVSYHGAPYGWGYLMATGAAYLSYVMSSYTSIVTGADFTAVVTHMVDNPA